MIPLTDAQILSRRFNYGCCRIDYLDKWVEAKIHGDGKCAEENWRMFMFMSFAKEVVSTIPVEGEEHKCADPELAIKVIKRADCFCECQCAPPPPTNCDITSDFEVIAAIPFSGLPIPCSINLDWNNDWNNDWNADIPCVNVQPGDSYYILTGSNAGFIYTWAAQPDFNNDFNNDFNTTQ